MPRYTKPCQNCHEHFNLSEFGIDESTRDKLDIYCPKCRKKKDKEPKSIVPMKKVEKKKRSGGRVQQIDINSQKVIETFDSAALAAESFEKNPANIRRILRAGKGSAHGFFWKYE